MFGDHHVARRLQAKDREHARRPVARAHSSTRAVSFARPAKLASAPCGREATSRPLPSSAVWAPAFVPPPASLRQAARRVIVKARYTRIIGADLGAARAHIKYGLRDGVTREGDPGHLYDRRIGGQDRPGGGGCDPNADPRGGVPGLQLRVPNEAQPAPSAGCARVRAWEETDQLGARLRRSILFRQGQSTSCPCVSGCTSLTCSSTTSCRWPARTGAPISAWCKTPRKTSPARSGGCAVICNCTSRLHILATPLTLVEMRSTSTIAPPTLAKLRKFQCWVWLNCPRWACLHYAPMALAPPIIRWGSHASSNVLRWRPVHPVWAQGATLQTPGWGWLCRLGIGGKRREGDDRLSRLASRHSRPVCF